MARHFFPGGNTPAGFFSYFENIPWNGERTIYLKGTSGSGKSTFMRRAAAAFEARGHETEYFHCSNDPGSLDGVRVPGASLCIVDATAPHVQDPGIPLINGEIFNMAQFVDPKAIMPYKDELAAIAMQKKQSYAEAYGYLAAAWAMAQNNERRYDKFLNRAKLNGAINETLALFENKSIPEAGRDRRLFAGALTPEGFFSTLDSLTGLENVYVLRGEHGMGIDRFLSQMRGMAHLRGFDTETLCCPLAPGRPEHLIIPALGLGFFTKNRLWQTRFPAHAREINFYDFLDEGINNCQEALDDDNALFDELAGRAVRTLAAQRKLHDSAEEIYIRAMDFDALNEACAKIIDG